MQDQIRDYRILRLLGEGGMGVVYLAEDINLGRHVALKMLNPVLTSDPKFRERFIQEARVQASLIHPYIVALFAFFEEQRAYFMAMEYAPGETLKDLIVRNGPLPEVEALRLLAQLGAAVGYAHNKGVVHRDLKPSNIMVSPDGEVKVMDFGIARILGDRRMTMTGARLGTLDYMSPEQVHGAKDIDQRSDIFNLGMTLYEMLTAKYPYQLDGDSEFAVMEAIVHGQMRDPREYVPGLSPGVVQLLERMLEKEPEKRPDSCELRVVTQQVPRSRSPKQTTRRPRRFPKDLVFSTNITNLAFVAVNALSFTNDGSTLICACDDGSLLFCDPQTSECFSVLTHKGHANAIAVSPDDRHFATCGNDGRIVLHSIRNQQLIAEIKFKNPCVNCLTFLPDGLTIAAGVDENLILWDGVGKNALAKLPIHAGPIDTIVSCKRTGWLVSGGDDGHICIWDSHTRQIVHRWKWAGGAVYCLAISEDEKLLLVGGESEFVSLYNFSNSPSQATEEILGQNSLAFAFEDRFSYLIAGGGDGKVLLWDVKHHAMMNQWQCEAPVHAVAICYDISAVAFASLEGEIHLVRI
jgi:serine/threonine protein kinase